jgi:hypothetical protein
MMLRALVSKVQAEPLFYRLQCFLARARGTCARERETKEGDERERRERETREKPEGLVCGEWALGVSRE